ncbi:MAG TPA: AAA family ATPase [Vicinamibacterales bacterium]|nr:AAA family ATPase [Vicinamibacterales bacterium]
MIEPPLDNPPRKRSLAGDLPVAAGVSALDSFSADRREVATPAHAQTIDVLSDTIWSEVAAQWNAAAPLDAVSAPAPAPRSVSADAGVLHQIAEHDRALNELIASITRGDAVVVLTGERGIGKTTVCRAVVDRLDRRILVSSPPPAVSADDLLKTLLVDFGVVSDHDIARRLLASTERVELWRALGDFLSSLTVLQASALVIIDDAHALPAGALGELRALCEMTADQRLLQIMLVGEPVLTRLLRKGDLRALDERVALRVELGPLTRDELPDYVTHRVALAGRGSRVRFADAALNELFKVSDGVPRLVNRICDRALAVGVQSPDNQIDAKVVTEAAHELGLGAQRSRTGWNRALIATLLAVLLVGGAAVAGWMFREPLSRAIAQWSGGDRPTSSISR